MLIISEYFPTSLDVDVRGGMELRAFEIARRISRKHLVTVITSKETHTPNTQIIDGVHILRVGRKRSYVASGGYVDRTLFMLDAMFNALHTDFDVIEGSGFFSWLPVFMTSMLRRKKRVLVFADDISEYLQTSSNLVSAILGSYQRLILSCRWDRIIGISRISLIKIKDVIKKSKSEVIYCGVDQKLIDSINTKKIPNRIVCVSRLVKYKRVEDLIKACAILSSKRIDFQLCIVGSGEEEMNLKLLSTSLGMNKKIKYFGFMKSHLKVLELIKSSSIFCLPSIVEGFGIAVLESLATGTPAVVSDLPIHREVSKGFGTIYYRACDPADLAQKLEQLLVQAKYRNELGKSGKLIAAEYDWNVISRKVESVYENLCNN